MNIRIILGRNVKKYREQKHLSQERFAEISGLHRTYISGIERGLRNPTIEVVHVLANALNIQVCDLFEDRGGE